MMVKVAVAIEPPKQCGMTLCMKIFPLKNNALNAKNLSFKFYILEVLSFFFNHIPLFRFMVGDLSDSDGDTPSEPAVKVVEFQGTEETHRAFGHGTELIPW